MAKIPLILSAALAVPVVFAAWSGWQDPPPPPSPPPAAAVVPGTPPRHAWEGVYRLRRRTVDGVAETRPSRGYVAITHRHMFVCLAGPGSDADLPLLRSGVRTWRQQDDAIESIVEIGYYTDADGGIHVEAPGTKEVRRVSIERGVLRILQDARNQLEFERIE